MPAFTGIRSDFSNLSEAVKKPPHESSNPLAHAYKSLENIRFSRDFFLCYNRKTRKNRQRTSKIILNELLDNGVEEEYMATLALTAKTS